MNGKHGEHGEVLTTGVEVNLAWSLAQKFAGEGRDNGRYIRAIRNAVGEGRDVADGIDAQALRTVELAGASNALEMAFHKLTAMPEPSHGYADVNDAARETAILEARRAVTILGGPEKAGVQERWNVVVGVPYQPLARRRYRHAEMVVAL